uniref:Cytochrome b5 heme-binding domain-containing protein n=1 Tax=Trieres chinensis TaxID=1514140 RepID=A0A7S1ZAP6_TRICV|mmetsp:Transcript_21177/g.42736  ORF Transcript_21177/g.42736 Transcript_21177/m.42736 type:complete len:176 (+) Transcript_21177:116-643(+)|eukprot:CAMPEP_0183309304 /NCGR_PEP_ID=MMETSP0160_2-20130417/24938_1 /TAXON_ID=2839 ORGANISM="Odontella Sinensis, Strain Grunow 1884" /NCGR_SAMPLE_ID=MMETSP0160_2 /ASSEMBLY_ACC=CAM_ASM_000250 /LENGTH=175 /DNA_ID=CAMNT_0025473313 /DNA_START=91 /DNA_END=618 /DNA_ORIENTATION=+
MIAALNARTSPGGLGVRFIVLLLSALCAKFVAGKYPAELKDPRIITAGELASKIGAKGEGEVWLSVLGEVYDVTAGRDFYGDGAGYGFFAGKDASPCFATGKFNEKGLEDSLNDLPVTQLGGVISWRDFYRNHETYTFLGLLEGLYYDQDGKPTEYMTITNERIKTMEAMKKKEL